MRKFTALILIAALCTNTFAVSNLGKKMLGYLPTLGEVSMLTGIVNTYLQAASLVRVINAEIAQSRALVKAFDKLEEQSKEMWSQVQTLKSISIYDMDSWASWLDRAENLVSWETQLFTSILFNDILTRVDTKMTVNFASELKRATSYDISHGDVKAVLRHYYYQSNYAYRRKYLEDKFDKSMKTEIVKVNGDLNNINGRMTAIDAMPTDLRKSNEEEYNTLKLKKEVLETELQALNLQKTDMLTPTAADKQLELLSDQSETMFFEITRFHSILAQQNADLKSLYDEWEVLVSGKVDKEVNRSVKTSDVDMSNLKMKFQNPDGSYTEVDKYEDPGEKNSDIAELPKSNTEKPQTFESSNTSTAPSLADIQHQKNRIEYMKLLISQTSLDMELFITQAKAMLLARKSAIELQEINNKKASFFGIAELENIRTEND